MPAYTVAQLEPLLSQYLAPQASFTTTLAQVLPRIYAMGMWRDLVFETSLNAAAGYVSLPADAESVISCTINDNPRPVRSLWSDVKIIGRQPVVSPYFGIVDDGFHVQILDTKDVQGVDNESDVQPVTDDTLHAYTTGSGTGVATTSHFLNSTIVIVTEDAEGRALPPLELGGSSDLTFVGDGNQFVKIRSITYSGVPYAVDLVDSAYPDKVIATIPAGTGIVRVRRFRVSDVDDDTIVHLLLKRGCPTEFSDNTIVHLGNLNALKHGLLGSLAEDHADLERATFHWNTVRQLLDEELDAFRGAAKPTLTLNIWGDGSKPFGLY